MNDSYTYDPEDIESLMKHKSFSELYADERAFVLKHIDDEDEYESMRHLLLSMSNVSSDDGLRSRPATKEAVMAAFREQRKRPAWYTLNGLMSLLVIPERKWFLQPGLQLAALVGVILSVAILLPSSDESNLVAEADTTETQPDQRVATDTATYRATPIEESNEVDNELQENSGTKEIIEPTPEEAEELDISQEGRFADVNQTTYEPPVNEGYVNIEDTSFRTVYNYYFTAESEALADLEVASAPEPTPTFGDANNVKPNINLDSSTVLADALIAENNDTSAEAEERKDKVDEEAGVSFQSTDATDYYLSTDDVAITEDFNVNTSMGNSSQPLSATYTITDESLSNLELTAEAEEATVPSGRDFSHMLKATEQKSLLSMMYSAY
ncbi:hypothetical protein [Sanyastnella coralliicola]|uniref:hypothetical protein n=1 Tax=Sanyastnella coralliicola TaxID=3069118 RepID=UPI0027B9CC84|nr:hypothetical protein [Longitalea sp. SCSIO 12813]